MTDLLIASFNLTLLIFMVGLAVFNLSHSICTDRPGLLILTPICLLNAGWNAYSLLERMPALLTR